ncbi:ATP synthase F1 subunit delta [bacterium]|nr:ATP synthase F1 subunit delta [bacterium]
MVEYEYAKALFDLAIEEQKTELFLDHLNKIIDVTSASKDFFKVLASPLVEVEEKIAVVRKVFYQMDTSIVEFLCVLVRNDRFAILEQITMEYTQLLNEYNSILHIEVISSEELSKTRIKEIKGLLEAKYPNKKLQIKNSVNPKILYGLQILCNGQSLDISLKTRLAKLKNSL